MNRANQAALYQNTNLGLLSIRQAELNYYVSLNIAFGTQAALIGGFTYGVFTQNVVNEDEPYADVFQDIYWVTSAGTIAAAVHVIVTTMCIQVYGPGLALHGPVGSMVRATEGMRIEQRQVIISFVIMMFLFSLSTILSFWAVMSFPSAVGGTIVFVIASRQWYYYSERVFLRFFWNEGESKWQTRDDDNPAMVEPPIPNFHANPIHDHQLGGRALDEATHRKSFSDSRGKGKSKKSLLRVFRFSRSGKASSKTRTSSDATRQNSVANEKRLISSSSYLDSPKRESEMMFEVVMEGYLLKKGSYSGIEFKKEPWERRYFILNRVGQLFMYKNRQDYHNNAKRPIYHRPLNLHEFIIEIYNSEDPNSLRDSIESSNSLIDDLGYSSEKRVSTLATPMRKLRFQITLIPLENLDPQDTTILRQNWIFRCDTEEELQVWSSVMRNLSPESFRDHPF